MGGFGAIDIARMDPDRFCAVGAHSPAVWESASETASGAFDDDADFGRHDVISAVGPPDDPLAGKRVWLDVGDEDPFEGATEALLEALDAGGAKARLRIGDGGHQSSYWKGNWKRYMQFYARALKKCQVDSPPEHGKEKSDGEGAGKGEGAKSPLEAAPGADAAQP